MSENKMQESLTNVIAEGRSYKGFPVPYAPARAIWLDDFNSFLDRIEAAYKRDIEKLNSVIQATVSRSDAEIDRLRPEAEELRKQIGNEVKLREVCMQMLELLMPEGYENCDVSIELDEDQVVKWRNRFRNALAAPARNCDMGTADEQAKRLNEWCNGRHCINCQFKGGWPDECKLQWAQLPYNESEASHGNV